MTKKEIQGFKDQYGKVNSLIFEDGKTVYFRQPNRKELKLIMSKAQNEGTIGMTESFIKNCLLGGDLKKEEILSDTDTVYLTQIAGSFDDLTMIKKAEIKKH